MKSFDETWENIHATQEWGKYPSEPVIHFVARNYYQRERNKVRILDYGCGGGSHTWYLSREGFDVYAFDGSKSAIEKVRDLLAAEGLHADLRVRDALELDYDKESFDCVIDNATIYANCYNSIVGMYQNVYELLKPGGKLFTVSFSTETTGYGRGEKIEENTFRNIQIGNLAGRGVAHFYTQKELVDLLYGQVGFKNIIIDKIRFTDQGNIVEQFCVQAEK